MVMVTHGSDSHKVARPTSYSQDEVIGAVEESVTLYRQRERLTTDRPSAEIARTFALGTTLAVKILVDQCGQWLVHFAYNGVEVFVECTPEGEKHAAYEDDAIPLLPLLFIATRATAEDTNIIGVASAATTQAILNQMQIALAAIGPRIDTMRAMPVRSRQQLVVLERLQDAAAALLDQTIYHLQSPWQVETYALHALGVTELLAAIAAADAIIASEGEVAHDC